jgi:hypothetical protein
MKRTGILAFALTLFTLSPGYSQAGLIILGNLPAVNDGFGAAVDAGTDNVGTEFIRLRKAISFTMAPQDYPVAHVTLRLGGYDTSKGDVAAIGFYLDNGNNFPGALVGDLLNNPPSSAPDDDQFTFTPSMPLALTASTKYWLMVDATAGEYIWRGSAPEPVNPSSQVGASYGELISIFPDRTVYRTDIPSFEIVSTVPEAGAATMSIMVLACIRYVRCGSLR